MKKPLLLLIVFIFIFLNCRETDTEIVKDTFHNSFSIQLPYNGISYLSLEINQDFVPLFGNDEIDVTTKINIKNVSNLTFDTIVFLLYLKDDATIYPFSYSIEDFDSGDSKGSIEINNVTEFFIEKEQVQKWLIKVPGGNPYGNFYENGILDGFTHDSIRVYSKPVRGLIDAEGFVSITTINSQIKAITGGLTSEGIIDGDVIGENDLKLTMFNNSDTTRAQSTEDNFFCSFYLDSPVTNDAIQYFELTLFNN